MKVLVFDSRVFQCHRMATTLEATILHCWSSLGLQMGRKWPCWSWNLIPKRPGLHSTLTARNAYVSFACFLTAVVLVCTDVSEHTRPDIHTLTGYLASHWSADNFSGRRWICQSFGHINYPRQAGEAYAPVVGTVLQFFIQSKVTWKIKVWMMSTGGCLFCLHLCMYIQFVTYIDQRISYKYCKFVCSHVQ